MSRDEHHNREHEMSINPSADQIALISVTQPKVILLFKMYLNKFRFAVYC